MKGSRYLKTFTVFSYFQLILGKPIDKIEKEVVDKVNDNLKNAADGEEYINNVVNGKGEWCFIAVYKTASK